MQQRLSSKAPGHTLFGYRKRFQEHSPCHMDDGQYQVGLPEALIELQNTAELRRGGMMLAGFRSRWMMFFSLPASRASAFG
jgi:hypothetical protein